MRRLFKAPKYVSLFLLIALAFVACDKEYNTIDSEVLGEENANFNASKTAFQILAYNKKLDLLQINNLGSSLLGFYDDPIYGETTASFITQVTPVTGDPDFGDNAVIDSVILNIPYYSRVTGVNDDIPKYTLSDSIYGDESASIKLSIHRTNYFLRDLDDSNNARKYFSNANHIENSFLDESTPINIEEKLEELIKDTVFTPSNEAIKLTTEVNDVRTTTSSIPALRFDLAKYDTEKTYWKTVILDKKGSADLRNVNHFKNYFRGLYFKAEAVDGKGQMVLLNTNSTDSKITIHYTKDKKDSDPVVREQGTYTLNITGNKLNTFINNYSITLPEGDKVNGDEKLYLKGAGSMAVVDLFNGLVTCEESNTEETALDCFKKTYRQLNEDGYILKSGEVADDDGYITKNGDFILKRLINEAQLIIYEDEESIAVDDESHKFDRIYAYDIENNLPTFDYFVDGSDNASDPRFSKLISLGSRLKYEDTDGEHYKYKIRITEHLNNILVRDSTNTKLGLVLSNNVNITSSSEILESNDDVTSIPSAAILSPRGTVLHGSNASDPDKKMTLEIYLTESK